MNKNLYEVLKNLHGYLEHGTVATAEMCRHQLTVLTITVRPP